MGIPIHIKGFFHTRDAIILTLGQDNANIGITKYIYPKIAKKYLGTASRVERATLMDETHQLVAEAKLCVMPPIFFYHPALAQTLFAVHQNKKTGPC